MPAAAPSPALAVPLKWGPLNADGSLICASASASASASVPDPRSRRGRWQRLRPTPGEPWHRASSAGAAALCAADHRRGRQGPQELRPSQLTLSPPALGTHPQPWRDPRATGDRREDERNEALQAAAGTARHDRHHRHIRRPAPGQGQRQSARPITGITSEPDAPGTRSSPDRQQPHRPPVRVPLPRRRPPARPPDRPPRPHACPPIVHRG